MPLPSPQLEDLFDTLDGPNATARGVSIRAVEELGVVAGSYDPQVAVNNRTALQNCLDGMTRNGVTNAQLLLPPRETFFAGGPLEATQKVGGTEIVGVGPIGYSLGSQDYGIGGIGGQASVLTRIDCTGTPHSRDEVLILRGAGTSVRNVELRGARMTTFGTFATTPSSCALLVEGRSSPSTGKHIIDGVHCSCAKAGVEFSGYYSGETWNASNNHADHTLIDNIWFYFVDTPILVENINAVSLVFGYVGVASPLTPYGEVTVFDVRNGGCVDARYVDFNYPHICLCRWGYSGAPGGNWSQNTNRFVVHDGRYDTPSLSYSTGTVTIASGVCTFAGGATLPSWASTEGGATLRIGNARYKVHTRGDDTHCTLYDTSVTVSSPASYTLAHSSLTLFRNGMAASESWREVTVRIGGLLGHAAQDNNVVDPDLGPAYDPKYLVELGEDRVPAAGSSSLMPYDDMRFDLTNLPRINYPAPHGLTWTESPHGFKLA